MDVTRPAPSLELALIRHAETVAAREARYLGWSDAELTVEGEIAARALAAHGLPTDLVFSSDLRRAVRTAALAFPGARVVQDARLRELDFGAFDTWTYDENVARHGAAFRAWITDPRRIRPPGGELVTELEARVAAWLRDLPEAGRIVAIAHGGSIRAALALLDGTRTEELRGLPLEPCCIVRRHVRGASTQPCTE